MFQYEQRDKETESIGESDKSLVSTQPKLTILLVLK